MYKFIALIIMAFMAIPFTLEAGEDVQLKTEEQKVSYALGLAFANRQLGPALKFIDPKAFAAALEDLKAGGKLKMKEDEINSFLQKFGEMVNKSAAENKAKNAEAGKKFLEENKAKPGVKTTASGLQYMVEKEGTGKTPKMGDDVTVHYKGVLINGKEFDSSYSRGQPATFKVGGVIKGWNEMLQLMKEGGKVKAFIPSELAYGDRGAGPDIGPGETLIFDIELIKVGADK